MNLLPRPTQQQNIFSLEEQLDVLSDDELEQLKQAMLQIQKEETGNNFKNAAMGFGRGMLAGLRGDSIDSILPKSDKYEELLKMEALKNQSDPTRRKAQMEMEEIERKRREQGMGSVEDAQIIDTPQTQSTQEEIPPMYISVPKGKDKYGVMEYETKENPEYKRWEQMKEQQDKAATELKTDVTKGKLVNTNNLDLIGGVMRDLSQVYADAYQEGGAGGFLQSAKAGIASKIGDLPDGTEIGGKFAASGAFPGKRMELILKMMPMLTQQATKPEGSVRIITGVLDALGQTIPELGTAPRMAQRQLEESMRTFYRFARAAEQMGMSLDQAFPGKDPSQLTDNEIASWAQRVAANSQSIDIQGEEKMALDTLLKNTLSPINSIVEKKSGQKIGRFNIEVE